MAHRTHAAALLALALVQLALAGCGGESYDEDAHRAAYEARLGHEVADWETLRELAEEDCAADEDQLLANVAVAADEQQLEYLEVNVQYLCPDRAEDLALAKRELESITGDPL